MLLSDKYRPVGRRAPGSADAPAHHIPAAREAAPAPSPADLVAAPKVLLHDHLDGGLRPTTLVELARDAGHRLPTTDPDELAHWFRTAADSGSLERYLETFAHTCAVLQTPEALQRVAAECAEDLAADGVVYAEVRYAPEQHQVGGLTTRQVTQAVQDGFREGERRAREAGRSVRIGTLLTAMRHSDRGEEIADLVVAFRDEGVVGFDIAGGEIGNPPARHLAAFDRLRRAHAHFTVHAGEAVGAESIAEALQVCGADRIGHGVRITDDITVAEDGTARLGRLASWVRDRRVPLEVCPTSNLQTGAAKSYATHPVDLLARLRFRVTVNTDNRLVSGVTLSQEFGHLVETFGYGLEDVEHFTVDAAKSAFLPFDERHALIEDVIRPGFARLRAAAATGQPATPGA
ncbi:adenosine deaminase [Streptomyces sp. NPDC059740]|uniref:adenosine deaminase n=1 Tax=Streptomyces sp. NPDC059740 TaxID=3346926 RepID=UPI0036510F77